jgi:hypothetical protein
MFKAIGNFFKNFFKNIAADPVSSVKGVANLIVAGGTCYGMATGVIPTNVGIPLASKATVDGIHALGTDNSTGKVDPIAEKAAEAVQLAAAVTPGAMTINDHYNEIKKQAGQAQAVLAAAAEAGSLLADLTAKPVAPASEVAVQQANAT